MDEKFRFARCFEQALLLHLFINYNSVSYEEFRAKIIIKTGDINKK